MGGICGSSTSTTTSRTNSDGSTTSSTSSSVPDYIEDASRSALDMGLDILDRDYEPYSGRRVAKTNEHHDAAERGIYDNQGAWRPNLDQADSIASSVGCYTPTDVTAREVAPDITFQGWGQDAYDRYSSPYTNEVVNSALALYDEDFANRKNQAKINQAMVGSFGGGRTGVEQAELARGAILDRASLDATLQDRAYSSALGAFNTDEARRLSVDQANKQIEEFAATLDMTAQQFNEELGLQSNQQKLAAAAELARYGALRSSLGYVDAEAILGFGELERGIEQAEYDANYEDWLMNKYWDHGNLAAFTGALSGVPAPVSTAGTTSSTSMSNTRGTVPGASPGGQIAGVATAGLGALGSFFGGGGSISDIFG